jgi:hypothetical protein
MQLAARHFEDVTHKLYAKCLHFNPTREDAEKRAMRQSGRTNFRKPWTAHDDKRRINDEDRKCGYTIRARRPSDDAGYTFASDSLLPKNIFLDSGAGPYTAC